jgi:hypothetical protein
MSGTSNTNIGSNSNIGTGVTPTAALPPTSTATITMQTATPVSVPTIIAVPQAQPQTVAAAPAPPNADAVKLDGTASPSVVRVAWSRQEYPFRSDGRETANQTINERKPPCHHYVRGCSMT